MGACKRGVGWVGTCKRGGGGRGRGGGAGEKTIETIIMSNRPA